MNSKAPHFLLATLPYQSHLNPTLQLAKQLIQGGARVTFATTVHGQRKIKHLPSLDGLAYATFSDGFDEGIPPSSPSSDVESKRKHVGTQSLANLLLSLSMSSDSEGHHQVSFLIYCPMLYWAADVARAMSIPSAFLCIQSAASFAIYYHCLNAQTGAYDSNMINGPPPTVIQFEGLPPFEWKDLPSFLLPNSPLSVIRTGFREHIRALEQHPNPCVVINTFDALEECAMKHLAHHSNINLVTIGPLVPLETSLIYGCDLFENSNRDFYIKWLDSKPDCSVVYIAFGSLQTLPRNQMEQLVEGIVDSGCASFWVIRASKDGDEDEGLKYLMMNKSKELDDQWLTVPWCSQVEVLNHRAIGCFVTHCGWNSTAEALVAGVPMVALPRFIDQTTNAKLVTEVLESGVRVKVNQSSGVADKEEITRCVEMVMGKGKEGETLRRNAKKWRALALQATAEGGSSANNLKLFMEKACQLNSDFLC